MIPDIFSIQEAYGFGHTYFWIHIGFVVFFIIWLKSDIELENISATVRGKTIIERYPFFNFIIVFLFYVFIFYTTSNQNNVNIADKLAIIGAVIGGFIVVSFRLEKWFKFLFYTVGYYIVFLNEAVMAAKITDYFKTLL